MKDFIRLAEEIDKYKNEHSPVRKGDLKAAIRGLKMKGSLDEIEAAIRDLAAIRVLKRGFDLRLMSSVNDVSGIPTVGKSLIIVATVDNVLRFRIFDGDGKVAADTDEKRLTEQARQIADFRKQLESLWPPHELTRSEKDRIIAEVTSIVGPTL